VKRSPIVNAEKKNGTVLLNSDAVTLY